MSEASLVWAIRSGDESAMAAFYDRYSSLVYAVALRVLGDTGAAEDVLQEVFMQFWRNPAAFDSSRGNLGAWLGVITRNRAIDGLRKRRPETDIITLQAIIADTDFRISIGVICWLFGNDIDHTSHRISSI